MIFNSKYFPKIMYLVLIIVSLLILFSVVIIMENTKMKLEKKSITSFATEIDRSNYTETNIINETNYTESQEGEMYSTQSYIMYYVLIIGIIAGIFITFSVLKSTIIKNIEIEEEARRF